MAPEIIKGMGYSFAVDLWSLGIIIYELLCGFTPFGTDIEDPIEKYQSILEEKLIFPSELTDNKAKKLIKQLLSKTPEERLGGSFDALKAQKWFDNIDWKEFVELKCVPPFIPKIEDLEKHIQKNVNLKAVIESGTFGDLKTKIVDDWDEIF